jgi:chemotaxis protein histidine kinase CheA
MVTKYQKNKVTKKTETEKQKTARLVRNEKAREAYARKQAGKTKTTNKTETIKSVKRAKVENKSNEVPNPMKKAHSFEMEQVQKKAQTEKEANNNNVAMDEQPEPPTIDYFDEQTEQPEPPPIDTPYIDNPIQLPDKNDLEQIEQGESEQLYKTSKEKAKEKAERLARNEKSRLEYAEEKKKKQERAKVEKEYKPKAKITNKKASSFEMEEAQKKEREEQVEEKKQAEQEKKEVKPPPYWLQKIIDAGGTTAMLNKEIAYVRVAGKSQWIDLKDFEWMEKGTAIDFYENRFAYDKGGKKIGKYNDKGELTYHYPAFDVWRKSYTRKTYNKVIFNPKNLGHSGNEFNLYRGMSVNPEKGNCDLILQHIKKIWCHDSETQYNYVINWFARMVQKPYLNGQTCLVVEGGQGTGKGIILDMFQEIFEHHQTVATKKNHILGKFNNELATSIFVYMNESQWGGDKDGKGELKALITDKTIQCEKKYSNKITVKNCTHIVISSNEEYSTPMGLDDRRFEVVTVSNEKANDRNYFNALSHQIKNGGIKAFLYFLMLKNIKDFKPTRRPTLNKKERGRKKLLDADSFTKWLIDFVDSEAESVLNKDFYDGVKWGDNPIKIIKRDLIDDYNDYGLKKKFHHDTDNALGRKLTDLFDIKTVKKNGKMCYEFEALQDCKDLIINKLFSGDDPFLYVVETTETEETEKEKLNKLNKKLELLNAQIIEQEGIVKIQNKNTVNLTKKLKNLTKNKNRNPIMIKGTAQ